ncbi:Golgi Transport [Ophidiomyces ophidiicola]|nr:Golgi Transport [Ophidiomyces ophidiicola]
MWLTDMQKIGAVFCTGGILMFFDRSLLAMGNILFVIGLPLILGPQKTLAFFTRRQKLLGSVTFALGVILILLRWPLIGFCVEIYGLFILFGDFLVTLGSFIGGVPVVGPPLQQALTWIGTLGGRRETTELPV